MKHHTDKIPSRTALYFAYGSNMNLEQMAIRCPEAKWLGAASISNWAVVPRLYADLTPRTGNCAQGVLYRMSREDFAALDRYEGYPEIYTRRILLVRRANGELCYAYTYIMTPQAAWRRRGLPYPEEYRLRCATGARQNRIASAFGPPARLRPANCYTYAARRASGY